MTPLEPSGFRPGRRGADAASPANPVSAEKPVFGRLGDFLLRGGLTPEDNATLKTSADLLDRIFQVPDLPGRPYRDIPLLGAWIEAIRRQWQPQGVKNLLADYELRHTQARRRALMEARVRVGLWKQLCRDRGGHLRPALQKQLEDAINEAVMRDPLWAVECTNLLAHGKTSDELEFRS